MGSSRLSSRRRPVRVRTVVLGLVLLVVGVATGLSVVTGLQLELWALGVALLLGAGLALVVGGVVSALREARQAGPL